MSKLIRVKYKKEDEMIFISHLDLQRLLQRAFRRAKINLSYSEGFNPHPKMSYGNALALGVESQGEYVDIEIEDDIEVKEFLERINEQLPDGIKFVKGQEIDPKTPSLSSIIVYGEYIFNIDLEVPLSKEFVKSRVLNFVKSKEIIITKKNKKGKKVEVDIRPMIRNFDLVSLDDNRVTFVSTIATGSKANLNINILIPQILDMLNLDMDPREVGVLRRDLYKVEDGQLVTPL
ncbi:TIGR03936 family radical SAM-associated protein [Intestinibacter bartlettii]|nr:TIGR03936 family radical SAM-associated protein [Intestinibacter bartlettii]MDU1253824.1 TIGR03936 family radical SAM-associated protein [Peptostreptococcaceae bacterium]MDU5919675.1 TIGR03936 family radical SAM-associated protein [Clostridiales bacterium]MCB5395864.1 TIGR03936 family radical SAM-associated protein [Intestinibacter bartlettii]MCB5402413.1 TIGR03936 family radical SAM-associated protein [Intestinibacter bartlettii]MCB5444669.1 TIGR03936 family radical SAM-associated protein 